MIIGLTRPDPMVRTRIVVVLVHLWWQALIDARLFEE